MADSVLRRSSVALVLSNGDVIDAQVALPKQTIERRYLMGDEVIKVRFARRRVYTDVILYVEVFRERIWEASAAEKARLAKGAQTS